MKLLLDTNILIDYYARREPFFVDALKLRVAAQCGDVELWGCPQSFTDVEYILQGAIPIEALRTMMVRSLSFLQVVCPTAPDLAEGLQAGWPDLEDFLISRCATRVRADYLITRDSQGFTQSAVAALSPSAFFAKLEAEHGITYDEVTL